jgi:hypothetical protein
MEMAVPPIAKSTLKKKEELYSLLDPNLQAHLLRHMIL